MEASPAGTSNDNGNRNGNGDPAITEMLTSLELSAPAAPPLAFPARFRTSLALHCSQVFEQHGYGARPNALQIIMECPHHVYVTGGIMVRVGLAGDWMADIDVYVDNEVREEVAAYLSAQLKVPIIKSHNDRHYADCGLKTICTHVGTVVDVVGVKGDVETCIHNFDISICSAFVDNKKTTFFPNGFQEGFSAAKKGANPDRIKKYQERGVTFVNV